MYMLVVDCYLFVEDRICENYSSVSLLPCSETFKPSTFRGCFDYSEPSWARHWTRGRRKQRREAMTLQPSRRRTTAARRMLTMLMI